MLIVHAHGYKFAVSIEGEDENSTAADGFAYNLRQHLLRLPPKSVAALHEANNSGNSQELARVVEIAAMAAGLQYDQVVDVKPFQTPSA